MIRRLSTRMLAITLVCLVTTVVSAASGLVAVYSDGQRTVHRIVPTPTFTLTAQQSVHSQLAPRFSAVYTGTLTIMRGGEYTISGDARIEVDGLDAVGTTLKLNVGAHPLKISYQRKVGAARLQLRWASNLFIEEPIPPKAFGHNGNRVHKGWAKVERGRMLYENLSCGSCHGASGWKLSIRSGPDLSTIGSRATSGWVFSWLKNPRHYRQTSVMPVLLSSDKDIRDVATYLMTLIGSRPAAGTSKRAPKRIEAGKALFVRVGCAKCHGKSGHSLERVGSKFTSSRTLASYLLDPLHTDPSGRMPQMFDPKTQAGQATLVAEYLFHAQRADRDLPKLPAGGDVKRGRELVKSKGCISCHLVKQHGKTLASTFRSPQFTTSSTKRLLHHWPFDGDTKDVVGTNHVRLSGKSRFTAGAQKISGGKAFQFDGGSFMELTHFKRPDRMTITAWVKTKRGGAVLAWAKPGGGTREFRLGQDGRNSLTYGEYNPGGGWRPVIRRSRSLFDDRWHHVAVVRDAVRIQLYLDGKPIGKVGRVHTSSGSFTDNLLIGALKHGNNANRRFRGEIDDLAIWGEPLSSKMIASLAGGASTKRLAQGKKPHIVRYDQQKGCLAKEPSHNTPNYQLPNEDRESLQAFMSSVAKQPVLAEAPVETFYRRISQYNCTACHSLNQNEQRTVEVTDDGRVKAIERAPTLTSAGDKLRVDWLRDVLISKKRTRPWMKLRMPHFGLELASLPEQFPAASGSPVADPSPQPDLQLAETGLNIIGVQRGKASCIECHNYRGINRQKDGVVPAPDMAEIGQTLRRDWFRRWLHNPSRMSPGTSMPQFFLTLNAGQKERQIEALWSALVHQAKLPLPKGLIATRTKGTTVVVGDHPVLLRVSTRVPPNLQVDRAINVGLPGGRNFTYDAATAQLRYVWQGQFINAGPAWNGRGGNPVTVRGKTLYIGPKHFPLRMGQASAETKPRFLGYYLVKKYPIFRYSVDGVEVHERIAVTETHVLRRFTIDKATRPIFFVSDKKRKYTASTGIFKDGVLKIPAAPKVEFEVRTAHK